MAIESIRYKDQDKTRLDLFLLENSKQAYSRSFWTKMIKSEYVKVNDQATKAGIMLSDGDEVNIEWPEIDMSYADRVDVLYENDEVIILNKPSGMLVHSKGKFNPEFTIADFIADRIDFPADDSENLRAGIVHRLDRLTSGVLVTAKNNDSLEFLQSQFQSRNIDKFYIAVVEGELKETPLKIEGSISRDRSDPRKRMIDPDGKSATTEVVAANYNSHSNRTVLLVKPVSGRTHQIRLHLSSIGHPIIGDVEYGATNELDRFMLHAFALGLEISPQNKTLMFASIPDDMTSYINDEDADTFTKYIKQNSSFQSA
jgi:23S rRNA pseudouridine1911/1915/1917 synthase